MNAQDDAMRMQLAQALLDSEFSAQKRRPEPGVPLPRPREYSLQEQIVRDDPFMAHEDPYARSAMRDLSRYTQGFGPRPDEDVGQALPVAMGAMTTPGLAGLPAGLAALPAPAEPMRDDFLGGMPRDPAAQERMMQDISRTMRDLGNARGRRR